MGWLWSFYIDLLSRQQPLDVDIGDWESLYEE